MEDNLPPQTQSFIANKKGQKTKTYSYRMYEDNPSYVLWDIKEEEDSILKKQQHNLIHVTRPYLSGVDIAERRNLTYPFKSLLSRDKDGSLTSGLYFPVRHTSQCFVTLFYKVNENETSLIKVPLAYFINPPVLQEKCERKINDAGNWIMQEQWEEAISLIEADTGHTHDLRASLSYIATMLNEQSFLQQLMDINESINIISSGN